MNDRTIDLNQFQLKRPEKVRWIFQLKDGDVLSSIPSKSLRKFLSHSKDLLKEKDIVFDFLPISEQLYTQWYSFYEKNMNERGYDILASKELLEEKKNEGKEVEGLFFTHESRLVAGGIVIRTGTEMASLAYKASERLSLSNDKNSSLGSVLDFLYLTKMVEKEVHLISGGRSRNAFGIANTLGHIDYKLRFGYIPIPDEESPVSTSFSLEDKNVGCFLGIRNGRESLVVVKKKGEIIPFDFSRFSNSKIKYEEIEIDI